MWNVRSFYHIKGNWFNIFRKLLQATVRANRTGHFLWIGSDSWGAKVYPVRDHQFAAESAITILPYRTSLQGKLTTGCTFSVPLALLQSKVETYSEANGERFNLFYSVDELYVQRRDLQSMCLSKNNIPWTIILIYKSRRNKPAMPKNILTLSLQVCIIQYILNSCGRFVNIGSIITQILVKIMKHYVFL